MSADPLPAYLPAISESVQTVLSEKFAKRVEKRPFYSVLFAEAGSLPPRAWKSDVDDLRRAVKDERHDYLSAIGNRSLATLGDPAAAGELRSELLREVVWAPEGKRGMMQLERIAKDEARHSVLRETATAMIEARKAWAPVLERIDMMAEVVLTREEVSAQKAANALAAISPARLAARPRIAQMLDEVCRERLDGWEAVFVPAQMERILSGAKRYEEAAAQQAQTIEACAEDASGVAKYAKNSRAWWMALEVVREIVSSIRGYTPVEPTGRTKALGEAKATAAHLRAEFLGKMAEKISSAECEDRVAEIVTERERVTQGRLAATLRLRLSDGTTFNLVTDSVIKFGPRSGRPFAQYPTRFTQVKLPGMAEPAAQVAEADMAAVLRVEAPALTTDSNIPAQKKSRSTR
jgi:hypothetical protein